MNKADKAYRLYISSLLLIGLSFLAVAILMPGSLLTGKDNVKKGIPQFGKIANQKISMKAIIKIAKVDDIKDPFCSGFVIDENYIATATHCIKGSFSGPTSDKLAILDEWGNDTGARGMAVAVNDRVDVGLIQGDFKKFDRLKVNFYNYNVPRSSLDVFSACGYPYLQNKLTCTYFFPQTNVGFSIAGQGFLIPGMSGGPVINLKTGKVVGINSAMGDGYVYVAPTLGMLGAFGIEPNWRKNENNN